VNAGRISWRFKNSIPVMNVLHRLARPLVLLAIILPLGSCLTQRTVTRNGQTVEQGIVVKRPLKEAVENSR
jgi:hypothetical protein